MKLRLTTLALHDLEEIGEFLRTRSPQGALRVEAAIRKALNVLLQFPRAGRRQSIEGVRKTVSARYGYIIYYSFDEEADELIVLTIQHGARRRPMSDQE